MCINCNSSSDDSYRYSCRYSKRYSNSNSTYV